MKVLVGYFIGRTWLKEPIGKTLCAWPHRLFPTRAAAQISLDSVRDSRWLEPRFDHDVAEAWMHVEDEDGRP